MGAHPPEAITQLLQQLSNGNRHAEAELAELVYGDLLRIARRHMKSERINHTLQPTLLVNEAYLRLVAQANKTWQSRAHFYAVAAQLMRQILVDHARMTRASKRGGGAAPLVLDSRLAGGGESLHDLIAIDEALTKLASLDARQSRIVELRFFGGLTEEEIAEIMQVSCRTVKRDWQMAKAWLAGALSTAATPAP